MYQNISTIENDYSSNRLPKNIKSNYATGEHLAYYCMPMKQETTTIINKWFIIACYPHMRCLYDLKKTNITSSIKKYEGKFNFNTKNIFRKKFYDQADLYIILHYNYKKFKQVEFYYCLHWEAISNTRAVDFNYTLELDAHLKRLIVKNCTEKTLDTEKNSPKAIKYNNLCIVDGSGVEEITENISIGVCVYMHLKNKSEKTIGHVVAQLDEFDLK